MPLPVVNVYPLRKTLPTIFMYFPHHYFSVKYLCFFLHRLAPVPDCLKSNRILFSALTLMMFCWHICVYESQYFSGWILINKNTSFPSSFLFLFAQFRSFPLPSPTAWHCGAGFRNGNEMHGGTVSKSSRLNISLNGPANVCRFFLFKLAQNIGSGAKGVERALQWTPALLTPHDVFMCSGVIAWIITSTR